MLSITEKTQGSTHLDVAKVLDDYGQLLIEAGRAVDGQTMLRRAAEIREEQPTK